MKVFLILLVMSLGGPALGQELSHIQDLLAQGQEVRARRALTRMLARASASRRSSLLVRLRQKSGAGGDLSAFMGLLAGFSKDPVALFQLALVERDLKLLRRAERTLQDLEALDPRSPQVLALQSDVSYRRFDFARAARLAAAAGPASRAWARRQGALAQQLSEAEGREWGGLSAGLLLLLGLALLVARQIQRTRPAESGFPQAPV